MRMELEPRKLSIAPDSSLTISIRYVAASMRTPIVATAISRNHNNRARDKVNKKDNKTVKVNNKVRAVNKDPEGHKTNSKVARQMEAHSPATQVAGSGAASIRLVR